MGQFEMKYPSEASCAVSEVSLPLLDYFRNVEEESSAALRKEVFRFFIFFTGGMSMVGRPAWEEAVNRKLSFQNPFSCFLALCSGDAHGVSQRRFHLELDVPYGFVLYNVSSQTLLLDFISNGKLKKSCLCTPCLGSYDAFKYF